MMIIFLNSKCRPLSVYCTCYIILLYILHAELLVRWREREADKAENKYYQVYVKERLILFLKKKKLDISKTICTTFWNINVYALAVYMWSLRFTRRNFSYRAPRRTQELVYFELPTRVRHTFNIHSRTGCSRRYILVYIPFFLMHIRVYIYAFSDAIISTQSVHRDLNGWDHLTLLDLT